MHLVDTDGQMAIALGDPQRKIPQAHLNSVCKYKQTGACRYVAKTAFGHVCCKHTPVKTHLDLMVARGATGAIGDNCEGFRGAISQ